MLKYPLFTASYAAQVFAREGDTVRAAGWVKIVEQLRTSPALGILFQGTVYWTLHAEAQNGSDAPLLLRRIDGAYIANSVAI